MITNFRPRDPAELSDHDRGECPGGLLKPLAIPEWWEIGEINAFAKAVSESLAGVLHLVDIPNRS